MESLPHEVADFEPALALDGGADGLDTVSYTHLDVYKRQVDLHAGFGKIEATATATTNMPQYQNNPIVNVGNLDLDLGNAARARIAAAIDSRSVLELSLIHI